MADWVDLDVDDSYVTLLAAINDRDEDAATLFSSAPTNPIVGMIRYNRSTNKFEEYRTTPSAAWYELNIAVAGGGTGANTAAGARSALGLGSVSTYNTDSLPLTAGASVAAATLTGTVATARLGSGTANATKFLRGDQSWQDISAGDAIGVSKMYWGASDPDATWMIEDGRAISRVTHATLFALIGVTHGAGDGSTTFNIPDSRDRMPIGKSGTLALGATGGQFNHVHNLNNHTHPYDSVIQHTHPITDLGHEHGVDQFDQSSEVSGDGGGAYGPGATTTGSQTTGITVDNPVGSVASGTTGGNVGDTGAANPPYSARNFIIKVL